MKDYNGRELREGQKVVHGSSGRYGGFRGKYTVVGFTPKMVRVKRVDYAGPHSYTVNPENLVIYEEPVNEA